MPIVFIDRTTGQRKEEVVFGDRFLRWVYETKSGHFILETFVKRKFFSYFYGKMQDIPYSRNKIQRFVDSLEIDMREAEIEDINAYRTFNDFFTRKLKPDFRPIHPDPHTLVSPADGKILAWEDIDINRLLQVKGSTYSLETLLRSKELAQAFTQGICLIIRLCPADYHRLHFPDSGIPKRAQKIDGRYYSVNPLALRKIARLYCENKRELTLFDSDHFGQIALLEVGATCVGSIVQTYAPGQPVAKGAEKGYFKFGGSTMIMLLRKGTVKIDDDILANTTKGIETRIFMGERIGCHSTR